MRGHRIQFSWCATLAALGTCVTLSAQATPAAKPQSQTIRGRVLAAESGQPLPNTRVIVSGTAVSVHADLEGRFTISLPAGRMLRVMKAGYVGQEVKPPASDIRLVRAGAITGHVLDDRGDPVVGVYVVAATADTIGAPTNQLARSLTDDRGEYRIGGVPPASYTVYVTTAGVGLSTIDLGNGRTATTTASYQTFFPDTTNQADAVPLTIEAGQEQQGIDFHLVSTKIGMRDELPTIVTSADVSMRTSGDGIIRGVVTSTSGRPIPRARVLATGPGRPMQTPRGEVMGPPTQAVATTADDGSYEFGHLPAATYRLVAARSGFSISSDPFFSPSLLSLGQGVTLASDGSRERMDLELIPWGAITGRVVDEAGDPVQGALVGLLQVRFEGGRRRLVATRTPQRFTDDRGEFRLYSVQPGSYVLGASVADAIAFDLPGYVPTYYPGTAAAAEAGFIDVPAGADVSVADLTLRPALTGSISGKLVDASGQPTTGGRFNLVSRSVLAARIDARIDAKGNFEFRNVPPGQYVIQADRGLLNGHDEGEFAALPITVSAGSSLTDVQVQASRGSDVSGTVTFENAVDAEPPDPTSIEIAAIPVDFDLAPRGLANASPAADGTFRMVGVHGQRRLQVIRTPGRWTLKAIMADGRDITDEVLQFGAPNQPVQSIEAIFTDRVNEVRGTVADDRANPVGGARVLIYSSERSRWYPTSRFMRSVVTGADGTYSITGLPSGSYFAAATVRTPAGDQAWGDPVFLDSLRGAATVITLGDGERQSVNLRAPSR